MAKKENKTSNEIKKHMVRMKPMFQSINDALLDCHQHIIKAPLCKSEIHDMESMILRSAEAYMDDDVLEVWTLFGQEMKQMMVKDALKSLFVDKV